MEFGILDGNRNVMIGFVAPVRIINNAPSFSADSISLKRYALSQKAQRWEIRTKLQPEVETNNWFIHSCQHGHASPFWIRMPQPYGITLDPPSSNMSLSAGANAGANSVTFQGASALKAGSFISFGGPTSGNAHSKIYMIQNDITATQRTALLLPNLVAQVNAGQTVYVKHTDVLMKTLYNTDVALGISYVDGILSDPGEISLIESL